MSGGIAGHGLPLRRLLARAGFVALASLLAPGPAQAVGTAFTYQGRLTDAGNPASGSYDLQFVLFDAAAGGAQVGATLTRDDVAVTNGLFTVSLDFGAVFTGSKRWLELAVRPGASTGAYTTLGARQELTPSPNALFSSGAPWSGISGKPAGFADDVDNDSGGDITAVAAGIGLTGGGSAGAVSLGVDLGGSGSATTVARSDHDHFGQSWSGSNTTGLSITNAGGAALRGLSTSTAASGTGVYGETSSSQGFGVHGNSTSTTVGTFPMGVLGTTVQGAGVFGQSTNGVGVSGYATSATGFTTGVGGTSQSPDGTGVWGQATSTTGFAIGVRGETSSIGGIAVWGYATPTAAEGSPTGVEGRTDSPAGTGVHGFAAAASGAAVGVRGVSLSPAGFGGYFLNTTGGPAIGVSAGGIRFADGTTQTTAGTGDITAVTAGAGLSGGGTTGGVTLGVDTAVTQARISATCPAGSSIRVVDQAGAVSCETDDAGWSLTGNAGTNPAVNFIGTTDNQPLVLRVNNQRALRLERVTTQVGPDTYSGQNTVGGDAGNSVTAGGTQATIAGGGGSDATGARPNLVTDIGGTVGGGVGNRAGDAVGSLTTASFPTVAGGYRNTASGRESAVGGGSDNVASGVVSVVSGGGSNRAAGLWATIPGGTGNVAGGIASFAAGTQAVARDATQSGDPDGDEGTFVWADSQFVGDFVSTGANQFLIRSAGGVGINTNAPTPGGLTVAPPGKITFGAQTRQMIDLWGSGYGIGVQGGTVYFRTDPPSGGFAWFLGGTHNDAQYDPGPGGIRQMRLDVAGNLFVRGSVNPGGADFAEMLTAEPGLEPGDVLAIGPNGQLTLATTPYQDSLAGVYSTQPGLVGGAGDGESLEGKVPLAVAGVVPVKVTAENGPIKPGDRLTSSSTAGHAMRASREKVVVGVVIGKALEPLDAPTGVIRTLVVLQ
jgi:hypothetical protein